MVCQVLKHFTIAITHSQNAVRLLHGWVTKVHNRQLCFANLTESFFGKNLRELQARLSQESRNRLRQST